MKCAKYLVLPLAIAFVNVAQAGTKQVHLPFDNEPIFSKNHTGLFFNYDMSGTPAKKVVCKLSYAYKGWLEFRDQGEIRETGAYGDANGIDIIILTNKGQTQGDQYHADRVGTVKLNSLKDERTKNASASCHYEFDDNSHLK